MRRLLALALLTPLALAVPASAGPELPPPPCAGWIHGCDAPEYVYDACENQGVACRPTIAWPPIG